MIGGTIMIGQSQETNVKGNERHAERQEEQLAREIARSGYNQMITTARVFERRHPGASVKEVIDAINNAGTDGWHSGTYQGGKFKTRLVFSSPSTYTVVSNGAFGDADHDVEGKVVQEVHLAIGTLVAPQSATFSATLIESTAGYCSAVYLQRMVPKSNNGHGNNVDGVDSSNPGGSKEGLDSDPTVDDEELKGNVSSRYRALEPELIFASGKNRDGAAATYSTVIDPSTLLNFILAVDKDCSSAGDTTLTVTGGKYDYYHSALGASAQRLDEMLEGKYAMIERNFLNPNKYRIAFEDMNSFSDAQHADIKAKGYGDMTWQKRDDKKYSYGGSGWSLRDLRGYYKLFDSGNLPDFSDQVFEIELTVPPPSV